MVNAVRETMPLRLSGGDSCDIERPEDRRLIMASGDGDFEGCRDLAFTTHSGGTGVHLLDHPPPVKSAVVIGRPVRMAGVFEVDQQSPECLRANEDVARRQI